VNVDESEVKKFDDLADAWWNKSGAFKTLHHINPVRLQFITEHEKLEHKKVLDVGCGGGILTESLAVSGAWATGIDLSARAIATAKKHAAAVGLDIDYSQVSVEEFAKKEEASFDVVVCMELLEHVPDPASLIQACAALVKPGGKLFFSTLNRNPKAYMLAVLGAEYILRLLPKGTHDYEKFIRPSELDQFCRNAGLTSLSLSGMSYNPITKHAKLTKDVSVNYLLACESSSSNSSLELRKPR